MNKTCYLAGRISGRPYPLVYLKFLFWDFILSMFGYHVWNPCREISRKTKWLRALRICLENLHDQDYIFMIPGWKKSKGANIEYQKAIEQDKELVSIFKKSRVRFEIKKWEYMMNLQPEFDKDLVNKFVKVLRNIN